MANEIVNIHIENGILFIFAPNKFKFDLNAAKFITEKRLELCNGKSYPTLIDYGENSRYASLEARKYFTDEGEENISAAAFIACSIATRAFISSYLMIHKPGMPAKVFSNREKAIKWLKQFN
jgi:hypothetical protein